MTTSKKTTKPRLTLALLAHDLAALREELRGDAETLKKEIYRSCTGSEIAEHDWNCEEHRKLLHDTQRLIPLIEAKCSSMVSIQAFEERWKREGNALDNAVRNALRAQGDELQAHVDRRLVQALDPVTKAILSQASRLDRLESELKGQAEVTSKMVSYYDEWLDSVEARLFRPTLRERLGDAWHRLWPSRPRGEEDQNDG